MTCNRITNISSIYYRENLLISMIIYLKILMTYVKNCDFKNSLYDK